MSDTPLPDDGESHAELCGIVDSLELFAVKGREDSPIRERINGATYVCEKNPMGITEFSFAFDGDTGEFRYLPIPGP